MPTHVPRTSRLHALVFRISKRLAVPEFDVRSTLPSRTEAAIIATKVSRALELIKAHAPVRYQHLKTQLPRILVGATHNLAECHSKTGLCVMSFDYAVSPNSSAGDLALTFVHEGTHARLDRCGFRYEERSRARIERLCITSELILARRLPDATELVANAEHRLTKPDDEWSDEAFRQYDAEALHRLGWEGRVGYLIGRMLTWRSKRPKGAA